MDLLNLAYNGASTLVEARLPRISLYGIVPIVFLAIALIVYLNYRRKRQK